MDSSGKFALLLAVIDVATWAISANRGTIIASEITVSNDSIEPMDEIDYNVITNSEDTSGMTRDEQLSYVRKTREVWQNGNEASQKLVDEWSEADMIREIVYHNRAYRLLKRIGPEDTGLGNRVKMVNFENEQNFETYLRRFAGNLMFW